MPQSLSNVTVHIIFSTQDRIDFLKGDIRLKTHAYIATILRDMKSFVHKIGGTENHIHIACTLPRTLSQSDFLNKLKSTSSKWLKHQGIEDFYWQSGFGVFSVSQSHIDLLTQYIDNQMEHHKTKSFKDEFREFLSIDNNWKKYSQ